MQLTVGMNWEIHTRKYCSCRHDRPAHWVALSGDMCC